MVRILPPAECSFATESLEQSGLAGTVAADQTDLVAGTNSERRLLERCLSANLDGQIGYLEHPSMMPRNPLALSLMAAHTTPGPTFRELTPPAGVNSLKVVGLGESRLARWLFLKTRFSRRLRPVEDPELHRSIVELDMVRNIEITGDKVAVTIALTVAGCPLRAEITERVTDAVIALDGIDQGRRRHDRDDARRAERRPWKNGHHGRRSKPRSPSRPQRSAESFPLLPAASTRVIGVTSGKGGVGKSSVTVNLAVALAKQGHEVAILDADVYGFTMPKMLGITDDPDVVHEMVIPPSANGVRCISIGFFIDEDKPVMWRGPDVAQSARAVSWLTSSGASPTTCLIDMPPGTGDVAMSMAGYLPNAEILVVTTPQPAAQRVAQRSGMMAKEINLPIMGVIENMSWFTGNDGERYELFGAGGGSELGRKAGHAASGSDSPYAQPSERAATWQTCCGRKPRLRSSLCFRAVGSSDRKDRAPGGYTERN